MTMLPDFEKLYKVKVDEKLFSAGDYLRLRKLVQDMMGVDIQEMPDAQRWETRTGKWTKRFASWYYKFYGGKASERHLSELGGILGKMTVSGTFYVDFVRHADWEPGSFGEKQNSCWFTPTYGHARLGLFENNGFAMRFFNTPRQRSINRGVKGTGRAWILPSKNGDDLYLFNAYGYELPIVAKVLENIVGTWYPYNGQVTFYVNNAYINSDRAYRFSVSRFDSDDSVKMKSISSKFVGKCQHCHEPVTADGFVGHSANRQGTVHLYHSGACAETVLFNCPTCGNWKLLKSKRNVADTRYHAVCGDCLKEYFQACHHCGEYWQSTRMYTLQWYKSRVRVCPNCKDNYTKCVCYEYFKNETALKLHQRSCSTFRIFTSFQQNPKLGGESHAGLANRRTSARLEKFQRELSSYEMRRELGDRSPDLESYIRWLSVRIEHEIKRLEREDYEQTTRQGYEPYFASARPIRLHDHWTAEYQTSPQPAQTPEPNWESQITRATRELLDVLADSGVEGQSPTTQGTPPTSDVASTNRPAQFETPILGGSVDVEPATPREERESTWRITMGGCGSVREGNIPPYIGVDFGLSEQEVQRVREEILADQTGMANSNYATVPLAASDLDEPGISTVDSPQNPTNQERRVLDTLERLRETARRHWSENSDAWVSLLGPDQYQDIVRELEENESESTSGTPAHNLTVDEFQQAINALNAAQPAPTPQFIYPANWVNESTMRTNPELRNHDTKGT